MTGTEESQAKDALALPLLFGAEDWLKASLGVHVMLDRSKLFAATAFMLAFHSLSTQL